MRDPFYDDPELFLVVVGVAFAVLGSFLTGPDTGWLALGLGIAMAAIGIVMLVVALVRDWRAWRRR